MIHDKDKIQQIRQNYHRAVRVHLEDVLWESLEGNQDAFDEKMEELETALAIIWRFDRKLQNANALQSLIGEPNV